MNFTVRWQLLLQEKDILDLIFIKKVHTVIMYSYNSYNAVQDSITK